MKLGMFMHPIHDFKRGYHTLLFEDMEVIKCADELRFDEVWLGDGRLRRDEQRFGTRLFWQRVVAGSTSPGGPSPEAFWNRTGIGLATCDRRIDEGDRDCSRL